MVGIADAPVGVVAGVDEFGTPVAIVAIVCDLAVADNAAAAAAAAVVVVALDVGGAVVDTADVAIVDVVSAFAVVGGVAEVAVAVADVVNGESSCGFVVNVQNVVVSDGAGTVPSVGAVVAVTAAVVVASNDVAAAGDVAVPFVLDAPLAVAAAVIVVVAVVAVAAVSPMSPNAGGTHDNCLTSFDKGVTRLQTLATLSCLLFGDPYYKMDS